MNKKLILSLCVISLLFIIGCKDLPKEPDEPGTQISEGTFGGEAIHVGDVVDKDYAPPWDVFNNNAMIFTTEPEIVEVGYDLSEELSLMIKVNHPESLVYNKVYIYVGDEWNALPFQQESISGTNWIEGLGSMFISEEAEDFAELGEGEVYIVAYTCKKYKNEWKCGCRAENDCGYWMLQTFDVTIEKLPEEPSICGNDVCEKGETTESCPDDCGQIEKVSLSSYPYPFLQDSRANAIIVIADNASAEEVIAATNIGISLTAQVEEGELFVTKLASEIDNPNLYNLILIGGCHNSLTIRVMGCDENFREGEAIIKLYQHAPGKFTIMVAGGTVIDTRRAAIVLANYQDYASDLVGNKVCVSTVTSTPTVGPCEEKPEVKCTDSDGGIDIYTAGYCEQIYEGAGIGTSDTCLYPINQSDPKKVKECYCGEDNYIKSTTIECPEGCEDGACKSGEVIELKPSGTYNYKLGFTNKAGVHYDEYVFACSDYNCTEVRLGKLVGDVVRDLVVMETESIAKNEYFVVNKNKYSRILQYTDINPTDDVVKVKDLGTGAVHEVSYAGLTGNLILDGNIYLFNISDDSSSADIMVDLDGNGAIENTLVTIMTQYGAEIYLGDATTEDRFSIKSAPKEKDGVRDEIIALFGFDSALTITGITGVDLELDNSGIWKGMTDYGILVEYDELIQKSLEITYPKEQLEALVYVTN